MKTIAVWAVWCVCLGSAMAQAGGARMAQPVAAAAGTLKVTQRFSVEIDGVTVSGVQGIPNLDAVSAQGNEERARPGNHKPGKMVVTKDWSNTSEFYKWYKSTVDGKVERRSISVIFHNDAGEEAGRMNFYNCWPTAYTPPALNARNSAHATEKLEISYERMEWKAN